MTPMSQKLNGRDPVLNARCAPSLYAAVLKLAKDTERTPSQIVRLALLAYVERQGKMR